MDDPELADDRKIGGVVLLALGRKTGDQIGADGEIGAAFAQMPAAPGLMVQPVPPAPTVYPSPGPAQQDR